MNRATKFVLFAGLLVCSVAVTLLQENFILQTTLFEASAAHKTPQEGPLEMNIWYQEEEEEGKSEKSLNPFEFFQTIAQLGGKDWTKTQRSLALDQTAQRLAEIATQVGAAHLLRPVPPLPLDLSTPPKINVDCSNPIYSTALTGQKDPNQKIILDAAPFGWDVDYLEIRLLEISDIVHKVVVSEQNANHKGIPKPYLLVPKLLKDRLARFASKVDFLPQNVTHLIPKLRADPQGEQWNIEHMMRTLAINHIQQEYAHLEENDNAQVYVIQNDGDEIPERAALAHFKECELRHPTEKTWFAGFQYKRNAAYLQQWPAAANMKLTGEQQGSKAHETLKGYAWAHGPIVIPLKKVDAKTIREQTTHQQIHMGLGSANHLSSPVHPILGFLKVASTADSGFSPMTSDFYKLALAGKLTKMELRKITHMCNMGQRPSWMYPWEGVYDIEGSTTIRGILEQHLPWAVRKFGEERYPWLYRPNIVEEEKQVNDCLCFGKCTGISPNSNIFFGGQYYS